MVEIQKLNENKLLKGNAQIYLIMKEKFMKLCTKKFQFYTTTKNNMVFLKIVAN